MRSRFAFALVAATLLTSVAAPARAATRVRLYHGKTSQDFGVNFWVVKTDAGRFLRKIDFVGTFVCEDATTLDWGRGVGFGELKLVDGTMLAVHDRGPFSAVHFDGRIGHVRGTGSFSATMANLTALEQAQVCATGDQTWQVQYARTIVRERDGSFRSHDGVTRVRVGEGGGSRGR